jgi:hypothetical protein
MTRFWNNLHQVRPKSKDWNNLHQVQSQKIGITFIRSKVKRLEQPSSGPTSKDWNNLHQVQSQKIGITFIRSKVKRLEQPSSGPKSKDWNNLHQVQSQKIGKTNNLKALRARRPNGYGHICLRKEKLSFDNNCVIYQK